MALLPPGTSTGEGTLVHGELSGRDAPNSHPISAISGLSDWLNLLTTRMDATAPLRYQYTWLNQSVQDIILPGPLTITSAVIAVIRLSDGVLITPGVAYYYNGLYIETIRLTFTPAISGAHVVHVVR